MAIAADTPTTAPATDQQLATLGCVCHFQTEEGAPPVSDVAPLPTFAIMEHVRVGPGTMPAWSTQNLSDELLTRIMDYIKSAPQATPSPVASPTS